LYLTNAAGLKGLVVPVNAQLNYTGATGDVMIVRGCQDDWHPVIANFDYRVMYQPIDRDLPTNRFRVVDELQSSIAGDRNNFPEQQDPTPKTNEQLEMSRHAQFRLNSRDSDSWADAPGTYEFLDELMETCPGRDGEGAFIKDIVDGELAYHYVRRNEPLNAAYYSRFYSVFDRVNKTDVKVGRRRGFNDMNLFVAKTTRPEVVPFFYPDPITGEIQAHRYTYALPIEIIYRTPLVNWNPYSIVSDGVGTFHRIPFEFFENYNQIYRDPSDTNGLDWGVDIIQKNGGFVTGAGHYIQFNKIPGINRIIRQRYPIPPLYSDKNPGLMQTRALKHILSQINAQDILKSPVTFATAPVTLWLANSTTPPIHSHKIQIDGPSVDLMAKGAVLIPTAFSADLDHRHAVKISRALGKDGTSPTP